MCKVESVCESGLCAGVESVREFLWELEECVRKWRVRGERRVHLEAETGEPKVSGSGEGCAGAESVCWSGQCVLERRVCVRAYVAKNVREWRSV